MFICLFIIDKWGEQSTPICCFTPQMPKMTRAALVLEHSGRISHVVGQNPITGIITSLSRNQKSGVTVRNRSKPFFIACGWLSQMVFKQLSQILLPYIITFFFYLLLLLLIIYDIVSQTLGFPLPLVPPLPLRHWFPLFFINSHKCIIAAVDNGRPHSILLSRYI